MDMAKNVTFAHVLLLASMLKISKKFNILTCLVPCDPFLMGQVYQFHCLPRVLETVEDSISEESLSDSKLTECSEFENDDDQQPKLFNQAELYDLVRDLNLPKSFALILGSRLKANRMLSTDTTFAWHKHRESEYIRIFTMENSLIYCVDIQGLIEKLGTVYNPSDWLLFIDATKSSLKAVLLHNTNQFAFIPLAHSTCMK